MRSQDEQGLLATKEAAMGSADGWIDNHWKRIEHAASRRVIDLVQPLRVWVSPETLVWAAAALARQEGLHYLPVVDVRGEVTGVVCRCALATAAPDDPVGSVMVSPAITISADAGAEAATAQMNESGVGCLPVLDDLAVIGVLTRRDLRSAGVLGPIDAPVCVRCGGMYHLQRGQPGLTVCRRCRDGKEPVWSDLDPRELGAGD
jgi:CBS domain-containing protein